jgi:transmembrane sensor
MSLDDLGRRVAAEEDALLEGSDAVARVRARVAAPPLARRRPIARWSLAAVAAARGRAARVVVLARPRPPPPLTFSVSGEAAASGAWISAEASSVTAVRFSDGSVFAFRDDARARVESVTPDGAHIVMERGAVSADVVHRATSRWSVLAGPYEVHVTGTQFDVTWDAASARLEVHVTRGSVRVSGGGLAPRDVRTGEVFTYPPVPEPHAAAGTAAVLPPDVAASVSAPSPTAPPRWRELAAAGRFSDAIDAVQRSGVDAVIARSGPADLLALADAARFSSHAEIAERGLLALRRRYPRDARAARAAFDLGRLAFDQRHDYAGAASWFATYLGEDPGGTFDREAAGRLIEARQRAGDEAGSRAAAKEYLRRYPNGPHAPLAKSLTRE